MRHRIIIVHFVLAEIFVSIKFRDFVVKRSVFIFARTIFRETYNTQDVNTGDITFQGCVGRRQSDSCIPVLAVILASIDLMYILVPRLINFL